LFPPEGNSYQNRFVDKLVKVPCRNGDNEWILVHIEVQGYRDPDFARRMFTYYSRILDKYGKPITAFAIFTEGNAAFMPCEYYREFMGTSVSYRYNAFKILDQDEQALRENDNPFAMVVLTVLIALKRKHFTEKELLTLKTDLIKALLSRNLRKSKVRRLLIFIRCTIRFENRHAEAKFDKVFNKLTRTREAMGIEELMKDELEKTGFGKLVDQLLETREAMGIEKFMAHWDREMARFEIEQKIEAEIVKKVTAQNNAKIVSNLLKETSFSTEEIARLVGVSPEFVQKLKIESQR